MRDAPSVSPEGLGFPQDFCKLTGTSFPATCWLGLGTMVVRQKPYESTQNKD